MSDDASTDFLRGRDVDPDLEQANARMAEIRRKSSEKGFISNLAEFHGKTEMSETEANIQGGAKLGQFLMRLPRNITVAVMDAAMNTIDAVDSASRQAEANLIQKEATSGEKPLPRFEPQALRERPQEDLVSPELMDAGRQLRGDLAKGGTLPDQLTQSAAQFFIPFTGWLKSLGGFQRAGALGKIGLSATAEVGTMMTAFEPHEQRFADLLRVMDTNNGLANRYIDFMAADEDEGELEGRLKNAADSLAVSAAIGGTVMAGARALKKARASLSKPPDMERVDVNAPIQSFDEDIAHDDAAHEAILTSFRRTLEGQSGKAPVQASKLIDTLHKNITDSTPQGAFYKELLGRLKEKNLKTAVHVKNAPGGQGPMFEKVLGLYSSRDDTMQIFPRAFEGTPDSFMHMFAHESVHAATIQAMHDNPSVYRGIEKLWSGAKDQVAKKYAELAGASAPKGWGSTLASPDAIYGFTNPLEFIAEIESNKGFRQSMKLTTLDDGTNVWDEYVRNIAGILGISAVASNLEMLSKVLSGEEEGGA